MADEASSTLSAYQYMQKLVLASVEVRDALTETAKISSGVLPPDNKLEKTDYAEPPKGVDPEKLEKIIGRLHSLTTHEMRQYLKEVHYPTQGNKKQLRQRIRNFYRKEYASFMKKGENMARNMNKTARFFEYLVVIDFECTCEEIIYDYPHEIIEFPAVLVDVNTMKIVDKFRTFVRPTKRPKLDPFCIDFCHITQETVDQAPCFPEAYTCFIQWMQKHKLGEEGRRYALVTDGPHDIWKFFQYQCMQSNFKTVPHMFRHFIDLKRTFEQKTNHKIQKGKGPSPKERVTAIQQMLMHYGLEAQGQAHFGLDDSVNIARIAIELMRRDRAELRINCRISKRMSPQDERNSKKKDPPESIGDTHIWRKKLPLKLRYVSRDEFLSREYLDCDSCDEFDEE